ncbi:MAG: hypothetical protein FWG65_00815 [Turicibacter sp.]|nr:hypothetical protein [Turicibacter sp.]
MTETVVNTSILPEILAKLIPTEKVRIDREERGIWLVPVEEAQNVPKAADVEEAEEVDYIAKAWGSLAKYPQMSLDKFMERKRADKELDL